MTKKKIENDWMQTFTGKKFYPLDPNPDDIDIQDIAHALSMQCRFAGHVLKFYSVAQHCIILAKYCLDNKFGSYAALQALLHDSPEAYLVDIPRPIKYQPSFAEYHVFEAKLWSIIAKKFNTPEEFYPIVKTIDNSIIFNEKTDLLKYVDWSMAYTTEIPPLVIDRIIPMTPEEAEFEFLRMFNYLKHEIK